MACPDAALSAPEIQDGLNQLPAWKLQDNALERVYQGPTYLDALEKLNAVAKLSEQANHHPDLRLDWKKLTIRYWTHTANGVTSRDFELARQIEPLLAS